MAFEGGRVADPEGAFPEDGGAVGVGFGIIPSAIWSKFWCQRIMVTCCFHTSQFEPSTLSFSTLSKSLVVIQSRVELEDMMFKVKDGEFSFYISWRKD